MRRRTLRSVKVPAAARAADLDRDPLETEEWLDSLAAVIESSGLERARFLLGRLEKRARELGSDAREPLFSAYRNTIPLERQGAYPGDLGLEERITAIVRWNALAMVVRANKAYGDLGGHIASYASAAEIFELGFNHFFRGPGADGLGDLVFFQPHSAPGVYARAFLEGRLSEKQLANYRREVAGNGLCSYPHPWLMPDFWQFPTGSMGLGPIASIYHARFMRYLEHRGIAQTSGRRVWGVFGDGEMDEPESIAGLTLAAREGLDNLTFVINCNLQRLDGPVRGNGQIIAELESLFIGAGWNVIKVLWGSEWDLLFARDTQNALLRSFAGMVDGEYQTLGANDGAYNQEHFFGSDPELRALSASMTPDEIDRLKRGGHDFRKLYAAFAEAASHRGRPTVILAKTKKGFGVSSAESRMTAHQEKKLDLEALRVRFAIDSRLPLDDDDLAEMRLYRPPAGSAGRTRICTSVAPRSAAYVPANVVRSAEPLAIPPIASLCALRARSRTVREMSTTVALVRMFGALLREQGTRSAHRPDRCGRSANVRYGQPLPAGGHLRAARPVVRAAGRELDAVLPRGDATASCWRKGINEAGAMSSWIAAATSYSVHGTTMLPFYIYYSMFGFQRVGDLDLGRGRPTCARLFDRRDGRPHDAWRGGSATSRRLESRRRRDGSELPRVRSGVRLRTGRDRRFRRARDGRARRGRLLLPDGRERELCATVRCRPVRRGRRRPRHVPILGERSVHGAVGERAPRSARAPSCARRSPPRSCSRRRDVACEVFSATSFSANWRARPAKSSVGIGSIRHRRHAPKPRRDVARGNAARRRRDRLRARVSADRSRRTSPAASSPSEPTASAGATRGRCCVDFFEVDRHHIAVAALRGARRWKASLPASRRSRRRSRPTASTEDVDALMEALTELARSIRARQRCIIMLAPVPSFMQYDA